MSFEPTRHLIVQARTKLSSKRQGKDSNHKYMGADGLIRESGIVYERINSTTEEQKIALRALTPPPPPRLVTSTKLPLYGGFRTCRESKVPTVVLVSELLFI